MQLINLLVACAVLHSAAAFTYTTGYRTHGGRNLFMAASDDYSALEPKLKSKVSEPAAKEVEVKHATETSAPAANTLADVLLNEVMEEESNDQIDHELEDIKKKILQKFQLTETEGIGVVKLTGKSAAGKTVSIKFDVQHQAEVDDDDEDIIPISFQAVITNESTGEKIRFDCVAAKDMEIRDVRFFPANLDVTNRDVYAGPEFSDLEESMQEEFYNYLADNMVDEDLSFFILSYSRFKEEKEYVLWLKKIAEFSSKA